MIEAIEAIEGVKLASLNEYNDSRGSFIELFRNEFFPNRSWEKVQLNLSKSKAGVLRGLHYHYNQVDFWYVPHGVMKVVLFDLREDSKTFKNSYQLFMGEKAATGLCIPPGVAHGFYAIHNCYLLYVVDNFFDNTDEYGIKWNDPQILKMWGDVNPFVSDRDKKAPYFENIKCFPMMERI